MRIFKSLLFKMIVSIAVGIIIGLYANKTVIIGAVTIKNILGA